MKDFHEKIKNHQCQKCDKKFTRSFILKNHVLAVHDQSRFYNCIICSKTFNTKNHLTRHMNCHNENKFQCDICKKAFNFKTNMKTHMLMHEAT